MHELSIATALVGQVEKYARKEGATKVNSVTIAVGSLSGVDEDALQFAFPIAADKTIAENASLVIEKVRASIRCRACGELTYLDTPFSSCGKCKSTEVDIVTGRELNLKSMDVTC